MKVVVISAGINNDDPWFKIVRQNVIVELKKDEKHWEILHDDGEGGVDLSFHRWLPDLVADKKNKERMSFVAVGHDQPSNVEQKTIISLIESVLKGMERIVMTVVF